MEQKIIIEEAMTINVLDLVKDRRELIRPHLHVSTRFQMNSKHHNKPSGHYTKRANVVSL